MKKDFKFYVKLFWSTFTLSAFTFGGGYVIVPLMRKRFVEQLGWLDEEEMLDYIAIAQASPGPIAVNASILVGYRLAGFWGAMSTILGTILPPLIILSVLSLVYLQVRDNHTVALVLRGMQAGVTAVIADVIITMASKVFKQKEAISIVIMLGALAAVTVFKINVVYVILFCIALGLLRVGFTKKDGK